MDLRADPLMQVVLPYGVVFPACCGGLGPKITLSQSRDGSSIMAVSHAVWIAIHSPDRYTLSGLLGYAPGVVTLVLCLRAH
jgi:hypothetical protein